MVRRIWSPKGAAWRYLDNGSDQGTAWQEPDFDDATWNVGSAEFGYGDVVTGTVHVAIGREDWFDGSAGGVAFVNSFSRTGRTVVFSFTNGAGRSAKNVAEVSSHEAGHAFGLSHQSRFDDAGNETDEYNPGMGDWAPIMGLAYSANLSTWHNGPTSSPNNTQDDMSRIARDRNGFGYRTDDHGNTANNATVLQPIDGVIRAEGIIERNSDRDVFGFSIAGSQDGVSFEVDGAEVGSNLDIVLELRAADQQLLVFSNPTNSYGASLTAELEPGDYTITVRNNGEYGRVGQYTIQGLIDEPRRPVGEFQRIGPPASLMLASRNHTGNINFAGDSDEFVIRAVPGDLISVRATPNNPATTLNLSVVGEETPAIISNPGAPVALQGYQVTEERNVVIRLHGDRAGSYSLDFGKNLVFEAAGTSDFASLSLDASQLSDFAGRLAVAGQSGDGSDTVRALITRGSSWKYLDDGSNQGTAWRNREFNDDSWNEGNAELGYGDGDETTLLNEVADNGNRIRTFYFRKEFHLDEVHSVGQLSLDLKYDDGAAVYLNGVELIRQNLANNAGSRDLATASNDDENTYVNFVVPADALTAGRNVLAVEVHQRRDSSSDVSFDLALRTAPQVRDELFVISRRSQWRYLDDGSDQGTAWTAVNHNDATWRVGNAELGYGDGDEATVVDENGTDGSRTRTFYFRKSFSLSDPNRFASSQIRLKFDDGAAVYVNGVEIIREKPGLRCRLQSSCPQ